jgi:hypothetical protein
MQWMPMPRPIIMLLLACLTSAAAGLAQAAAPAPAPVQGASPLYGVEIIIFRASSPGADEDWTAPVGGRGFGTAANRGGAVPGIVKLLGPGDYHMTALENSLKSSGAWRPIAHAAWIQTAANWGTHTGFALSDLGIEVPGLSGSVYVERAPIYIHLGFDVQYQGAATYTIREMRSVKYNDKQYFDHPAFGIIALVSPIKRASDPAADAH